MKYRYAVVLFFWLFTFQVSAQDTIYLKNGDKIIGELKALEKGVITFSTDYSDSDFRIEWKGIDRLSTGTIFLIITYRGERIKGSITRGDSTGLVINTYGVERRIPADEIVSLKLLDQGFWSKVNANIDVGLNLTKAKNLRQLTVNSGIGYNGENWVWQANYNTLNARQDSVEPTLRTDGGLLVNRYLAHDIFATSSISFLSNTEQLLNLRSNLKIGAGYYFVHSNRWYWNASIGVAGVSEDYSNGEGDLESMEAFISTELSLFDFGDLSFFTRIAAFPGITETGRFRTDVNLDLKYDLPLDLYIKTGFTVNYDNQPTVGAAEMDYVINTGLGWSW